MSSNSAIIPKTRSRTTANRSGASLSPRTLSPDRAHPEDVETEHAQRNITLNQKRTPNSRKTESRTTKDSTERVLTKVSYGERCTITLDGGPCLEGCHVVCRSTESNVLDCLEYAWGYHYRQFNVDTGDNLIQMRVDWHRMYDARHWMLVPTPNMVQTIYAHCMKFKNALGSSETKTYPHINQAYPMAASHEYYVLAVDSMSEVIINRLILPPDAEGDPAIPPHRFHRFPFDTLGPIKSHILPQYAIFNCGSKLRADNLFPLLDRYTLLTGNEVEAKRALHQIAEPHAADNYQPPRARSALKKRKASRESPTPASGSRAGSTSGANKRHARNIVLPSPYDSDSECGINSDTPLTEAEVMEMHDSLKMVSSWRTTSSQEFSQGHQHEKTIASRRDIGEHTEELPCKARTVDLTPEGPPVNCHPSRLVAAALEKVESMNR